MITLNDMKRIDPKLSKYSDQELEKIRALLYSLGQLAFDSWMDRQKGSKKSPKGIAKAEAVVPHLPQ
jgi:hypothetical protein